MSPIAHALAERALDHLAFLYGPEVGSAWHGRLMALLTALRRRNPALLTAEAKLDQTASILITYGDQVREPGRPPLQSLAEFLGAQVKGVVSGVHILPFYPYSSDDGFSVIDYEQVDPALGDWADVTALGRDFDLMFDAVVNHISAQSEWFQGFLRDESAYADYFIVVEPGTDLSQVTRPRALPLLTPVQTPSGEKLVWTTFSDDQIDLNYANPEVLFRIIELLLTYVERGATLIRLDAIAYLWKIIGTACIHLEQTHRVVQLMRVVLDAVAPGVKLITETNVPHAENISYLGDGTNEAQLVYNFSLAPLLLNAIQTGRAEHLSRWAAGLTLPSDRVTLFNFTASHDGVGVMPARGILREAEIQALVDGALAHGGRVSFKANPDGSQSVYELNISYFDALSDPTAAEPQSLQVARFILSQTVMLALAGVPGIYIHSLLGSRSWRAGVELTGRNRTINRQKFHRAELEAELARPESLRYQVFQAYAHRLRQRAAHPAFHPQGAQRVVLADNPALFCLLRTAPDGESGVLCLHNFSGRPQVARVVAADLPAGAGPLIDLIDGERYPAGARVFGLAPYQALWLKRMQMDPDRG
jgi:glycosidase